MRILFTGAAPQAAASSVQRNLENTVHSLSEAILIVVVTIVVLGWLRVSTHRAGVHRPLTWQTLKFEFRIGCISEMMTMLGFAAAGLLAHFFSAQRHSFPSGDMHKNLDWVSDLASSFAAGPVEELLLVVLLVWLLRSSGHSWTVVCIAAVALRIVFHFYYGWTTIGMALWPLLVIYLYKRTGAVWGIIAAHSLFDIFGSLTTMSEQAGLTILSYLFLLLKLAPAIIGLVYVYRAGPHPKTA